MSECTHYWKIEVANGPTSTGTCKYCGKRRKFSNIWSDDFNRHTMRRSPSYPIESKEVNQFALDENGKHSKLYAHH